MLKVDAEWVNQFKELEKIFARVLADNGEKYTFAQAAKLVGVNPAKFQKWKDGQRPSTEDMGKICQILRLEPKWALLGIGHPFEDHPEKHNPDFVSVCDTLFEIVESRFFDRKREFAESGGLTLAELDACTSSRMLPPATSIAKWMRKYKINANFLLNHIGQPFLTDEEYKASGPATWVRERDERDEGIFGDEEDAMPSAGRMITIRRLAPGAPSDPACIVGPDDETPVGQVVPVHAAAAAGPGMERWEPEPIAHVCIPLTYYRESILIVQIDGRSMEPEIRSGAFVGLDTAQRELVAGEKFGVRIPYEGLTVKRVFIDLGARQLVLRSINPEHPEMRVPLDEHDGLIVGRAVWVMQGL